MICLEGWVEAVGMSHAPDRADSCYKLQQAWHCTKPGRVLFAPIAVVINCLFGVLQNKGPLLVQIADIGLRKKVLAVGAKLTAKI